MVLTRAQWRHPLPERRFLPVGALIHRAAGASSPMKNLNLSYWIPTALFSLALGLSGFGALTHQAPMVAGYTHLGYPVYFMTILGAAKLLGVATLLAPGLPRLKEWAYAGFTINLASAALSHLASGDPAGNAVAP